jgi:hypothetical protein
VVTTNAATQPQILDLSVAAGASGTERPEVTVAPAKAKIRRLRYDAAGRPIWHTGDRVRAERAAGLKGTWKRYAGRTGTVRTVDRKLRTEVGVELDDDGSRYIWFEPTELVPA